MIHARQQATRPKSTSSCNWRCRRKERQLNEIFWLSRGGYYGNMERQIIPCCVEQQHGRLFTAQNKRMDCQVFVSSFSRRISTGDM